MMTKMGINEEAGLVGYGSIEEDRHSASVDDNDNHAWQPIYGSRTTTDTRRVVLLQHVLLVGLTFSGVVALGCFVLVRSPMVSEWKVADADMIGGDDSHFLGHPNIDPGQFNHDPTRELFFDQLVDHNDDNAHKRTFPQRYYVNFNHWRGPGHPIFVIIGGEGPLERILYPFVSEVLASRFGAVTFNPEHRYFGVSYPIVHYTKRDIAEQLTPRQALQDIVYFIQTQQQRLQCGPRGSSTFCPVLAVGASYSGLLSTLIRKTYPNVVDMAYAGSPCLWLFGHQVSPYTYYEYITQVAQRISPGCPTAVREAISYIQSDLNPVRYSRSRQLLASKAQEYGFCGQDLPQWIETGEDDLASVIIGYTSGNFGNTLMDYYPPGPDKAFFQGCAIFQNEECSIPERVQDYIQLISGSSASDNQNAKNDTTTCYSLSEDDNAEDVNDLWTALCCYLVPMIGKSNQTMWPAQRYHLQDDIDYCQTKYGITPDPNYLEKEFGLNDLAHSNSNVTRLVMTNGLNDGWYPTSYPEGSTISSNGDIVIYTMKNGAHHSDLTHQLQVDTPDVDKVHSEISDLIALWLEQVRDEGS